MTTDEKIEAIRSAAEISVESIRRDVNASDESGAYDSREEYAMHIIRLCGATHVVDAVNKAIREVQDDNL